MLCDSQKRLLRIGSVAGYGAARCASSMYVIAVLGMRAHTVQRTDKRCCLNDYPLSVSNGYRARRPKNGKYEITSWSVVANGAHFLHEFSVCLFSAVSVCCLCTMCCFLRHSDQLKPIIWPMWCGWLLFAHHRIATDNWMRMGRSAVRLVWLGLRMMKRHSLCNNLMCSLLEIMLTCNKNGKIEHTAERKELKKKQRQQQNVSARLSACVFVCDCTTQMKWNEIKEKIMCLRRAADRKVFLWVRDRNELDWVSEWMVGLWCIPLY